MTREPGATDRPLEDIPIALFSSYTITGEGIKSILKKFKKIEHIANLHPISQIRDTLRKLQPELWIVNSEILERKTVSGLCALVRKFQKTPIFLLLKSSESLILAHHVRQAGTVHSIPTMISPSDFHEMIRAFLIEGTTPREFKTEMPLAGTMIAKLPSMTRREWEIFHLLGDGYMASDISGKLHISPRTVECYQMRMRKRLGVESSREVMRFAIRWQREMGASAISEMPVMPDE